jgi:hypothetical protein
VAHRGRKNAALAPGQALCDAAASAGSNVRGGQGGPAAAGMQQNATRFAWTGPRSEAAQLLAEDELTDEEISAKVGVDRTTLWRWRKFPAFQARIAELVEELGAVASRYAIGRKACRLRNLSDRLERMHQVIRVSVHGSRVTKRTEWHGAVTFLPGYFGRSAEWHVDLRKPKDAHEIGRGGRRCEDGGSPDYA